MHGVPFTFFGLTFDEYINRQRERFIQEKENVKLARAKAKDEKKSAKKTPLSASRRNLTNAMSLRGVQTSVKRKLPMDKSPVDTGINKKRLVQSEKSRPTVACRTVRRSGIKGKRILSNSLTKESPRKKRTPKIITTDATQSDTLDFQQYEEFQEHLSSRHELRSTLLSDNLLKNIRDGKRMKTPVKTPVKPLRKHLGNATTSHTTPKSMPRRPSRSPRITSTPRLTTAPVSGLSHLKL